INEALAELTPKSTPTEMSVEPGEPEPESSPFGGGLRPTKKTRPETFSLPNPDQRLLLRDTSVNDICQLWETYITSLAANNFPPNWADYNSTKSNWSRKPNLDLKDFSQILNTLTQPPNPETVKKFPSWIGIILGLCKNVNKEDATPLIKELSLALAGAIQSINAAPLTTSAAGSYNIPPLLAGQQQTSYPHPQSWQQDAQQIQERPIPPTFNFNP
ncbi:MAG: hypothetical protein RLZ12_413, partial [Bacillota bacterium]